jgi:hypothetical protein
MLGLALTLLLHADRAAIEKLPVLARLEAKGGTVLVLRGHLTDRERGPLVAWAKGVVDDVGARFLAEQAVKREVDACLFAKAADYRAFADTAMGERPSELGFYLPGARVVVVNLAGGGRRNMAHELTHALVGDDFPGIPSWLNEGLGSLYGGGDVTRGGVRFFVNYRHADVLAALSAGTLPDPDELFRAKPDEVYGERAMLWYGLARDFLLWQESRGQLSAFYAAMKAGARAKTDAAAFRRFVASVKKGARVDPRPRQ